MTMTTRRTHTRRVAAASALAVFGLAAAGCVGNSAAAPVIPATSSATATQTPLPVVTGTPTRPPTTKPIPTVKATPTGDAPPGTGAPLAPGLPPAPPAYLKLPAAQQTAVRGALISYDAYKLAFERASRVGPTPPVADEVYKHAATVVAAPVLGSIEEDYNAGRRMKPGHGAVYRFLPITATATTVRMLVCTTAEPDLVDKTGKVVSFPFPGLEQGFVISSQLYKGNWLLLDSEQPQKNEPTCV